MPYDNTYKEQCLATITNLQGAGQLYRRRKHTLDMILVKYKTEMMNKHKLMGSAILEQLQNYIDIIFNTINQDSKYEHLEYIVNIIKWYFKVLGRRKQSNGELPTISLPDFTIPEIKEIYSSITK